MAATFMVAARRWVAGSYGVLAAAAGQPVWARPQGGRQAALAGQQFLT